MKGCGNYYRAARLIISEGLNGSVKSTLFGKSLSSCLFFS